MLTRLCVSGKFNYESNYKYSRIENQPINFINQNEEKYKFSLTNLRAKYEASDKPRFEIFVTDILEERKSVRIPIKLKTVILPEVYYQIRDAYNGKILTPFTKKRNVTRVSNDKLGMYFEPSLSHLPVGRTYTVDLMTVLNGVERKYMDNGIFRIA